MSTRISTLIIRLFSPSASMCLYVLISAAISFVTWRFLKMAKCFWQWLNLGINACTHKCFFLKHLWRNYNFNLIFIRWKTIANPFCELCISLINEHKAIIFRGPALLCPKLTQLGEPFLISGFFLLITESFYYLMPNICFRIIISWFLKGDFAFLKLTLVG